MKTCTDYILYLLCSQITFVGRVQGEGEMGKTSMFAASLVAANEERLPGLQRLLLLDLRRKQRFLCNLA